MPARRTAEPTPGSRPIARCIAAVIWAGVLVGLMAPSALAATPGGAFDALRITPAQAVLRGPDSVQQLSVEGLTGDAAGDDLTPVASYESTNPGVASVDEAGTISAQGDGQAVITVRAGSLERRVPVTVREFTAGRPINFANQIVPIFTKLGCNSGGCHGKATGQNGFKLSLLGFEPAFDYDSLVKEARGRRLFPAAPEQSLLLLKGTARLPHGGGRRLEPGSHEHRLIARWIAGGMPVGKPDDPTVARIEVYPATRVMTRANRQQILVTAHYSDGSTEDVTRWAQYQSNDQEVAAVAEGGQVETREHSGQVAIMARYQGQVAVFQATVPLGLPIGQYPEFPEQNFIDALAMKQWKALGLVPSDRCTDAEFIRRASLDVIATLPTPAEVKSFVANTDPAKRAKLVDRLLDRPEYASFFAVKWADVLRNKREGLPFYKRGTFRFYDWIRESLAQNTPYDQFVRSILAAIGTPETTPPVMWYRRIRATDAFVDDTAQVFLGLRLQCAKCHHHPFEKWSQDDYYGFAAFFARVGRKPSLASQRGGRMDEVIFTARAGAVNHPKTGKAMQPKGLGDQVVTVPPTVDPREKLVDWMADPKNPFFARAVVNRYWAHFFSRGIVEPMDDMRLTNPPSNPELLDALASDFVANGYDLKHLIRTICGSRVYGLSSIPNEYNTKDKQSFARHYPKRMSAEILLDAIAQVTAVPTPFRDLPAGTRAIELPDESVDSAFLDVFGRPKRETPCECERVTDASLGQSLMLLNSNEIQTKLNAPVGRAAALAIDPRPDLEKVDELFWSAFGRAPTSGEQASALAHIAARPDKKREAYEDIVWALVNAKEFQFND
jgi:hypothetical protein